MIFSSAKETKERYYMNLKVTPLIPSHFRRQDLTGPRYRFLFWTTDSSKESWRRTSLIYLENACGRFPRNSLRTSCAGPSQSLDNSLRSSSAVNKYYLFKKPHSRTLGFVHRSEAARLPRNYKDVEEALSDDGDGCLIQYLQGCLPPVADNYFLLEDHNTHTLGVVYR